MRDKSASMLYVFHGEKRGKDIVLSLIKALILLVVLLPLGNFYQSAYAGDELNCVLCHKHRGLSRVDEEGNFRLFYINEDMYERGPHFRVKCSDCHTDINEIPHKPAKKVDCTIECHITEPSTQAKFSHKSVDKIMANSVHSKYDADGNLKEHPEDYPGCKDCHEEPLYRPLSFFKGHAPGISKRGISRCKSCHTKGNFAESFYRHVTSRLQKTKVPTEMVEVCAKCHADRGIQERHDLDDVVTSYKETYHWKAMRFGNDQVPDCLDCHVVAGESVHLVEGQDSPTSSIAPGNVAATCRTSDCHKNAGEMLAGFQTHVTYDREKYPLQFYMLVFFTALMAGVMYFFIVVVFLELLRRLFPNFSFFKDKEKESHH